MEGGSESKICKHHTGGGYFVITQRGGGGGGILLSHSGVGVGGGVFCYHTAGWEWGGGGDFVITGVWVGISVQPNSY